MNKHEASSRDSFCSRRISTRQTPIGSGIRPAASGETSYIQADFRIRIPSNFLFGRQLLSSEFPMCPMGCDEVFAHGSSTPVSYLS